MPLPAANVTQVPSNAQATSSSFFANLCGAIPSAVDESLNQLRTLANASGALRSAQQAPSLTSANASESRQTPVPAPTSSTASTAVTGNSVQQPSTRFVLNAFIYIEIGSVEMSSTKSFQNCFFFF